MTRGWIFDIYPGGPGEMVVWLKTEDGEAVRLTDRWSPSLFVGSNAASDFAVPVHTLRDEFLWTRVVRKRETVTSHEWSDVLEVKLADARSARRVAERIERLGPFGTFRIYNADVPPDQGYLYENDLFPLAFCEVMSDGGKLRWTLEDDVWAYDYATPPLRTAKLDVQVAKEGRLPKPTDRIESFTLECDDEPAAIAGQNETEKLLKLAEAVRQADPDVILTDDGDTFLFPYLVRRAEANGVRLSLDRDGAPLKLPSKPGTSYFSYGQIHYKPSATRLRGRAHIDVNASFAYSEGGLDVLFELSRVCRMPIHTASRASIGKALSSLQFYHALKADLLVPWKPTLAERFKDRNELLTADRGGFVFEPRVGAYEGVGELDFSALYPNIMYRKNISAETVRCSCCPDSENRVPELGWNICRREGLVPRSIRIIVEKRLSYKEIKGKAADEALRARYDARQAALKWLGVTCLPGESPVLVKQGGTERFVRIGDFIDGLAGDKTGVIACPPDVSVAGLGPDYKAKYSRVANLIKKPNNQKLLAVEMEDGRRIATTPDHPFFVLRGGRLTVTAAEELRVHEAVPIATRISSVGHSISQIDLIDRLEAIPAADRFLWRVSGELLKEMAQTRRQALLRAAASKGYSSHAVANWIKSGTIPLGFLGLLGISPSSHPTMRIGVGRRLGGRIAWLPAAVDVGEELGFLLGLYVAGGSATDACVRLGIASTEPGLLEATKRVVASLFGVRPRVYKERRAEMCVAQVNSTSLARVLDLVFGLPGSVEKGELKVPELIFNCSDSVAHGFVSGMVAGDCHACKKRGFDIATTSKGLQQQIAFLASRLGLAYSLGTYHEGDDAMYTVNFVGPETFRGFWSREHPKEGQPGATRSWSEEPSRTRDHARYAILPAAGFMFKVARTSSEPHVYGYGTCQAQAMLKPDRMDSRASNRAQPRQKSRVENFFDSDLGLARVLKIERLDLCPDYVYCFQIAEDETPGFFTGDGLVFTHNCFGYLGFNNAKFGRIDAHIAVCAWDRKVITDAARAAEARGFEVLHGIVDSLWLWKEGAGEGDYLALKAELEAKTGFAMSFEGVYKWLAFLPSKSEPGLPALNRYFGAFEDGRLKVRGVEARRHDTPPALKRCQMAILKILAEADTVAAARAKVPECVEVFLRCAGTLERHEVPASELAFSTNLSKAPGEYTTATVQRAAAKQLVGEGVDLHAGEGIRYVIMDYRSGGSKRATPLDMVEDQNRYDSGRYIRLLAEACSSVLEPFDPACAVERLLERYEARKSGALA
ncbi:MAG: hypothetical protein JRM91_04845 [Nitrososphaerota archaeon]|jgi:DNA polymerase elongation subunit (family B)|nr:hypothetical protein [Nitrososphaerota archaeon]MDG6945968.1 hypothetical protein [Nitrososphaerota archaeon]